MHPFFPNGDRSTPVFVGSITRPRAKWADFVPPAEAAANLVDPKKIEQSRIKRREEQLHRVGYMPVTAEIVEIIVIAGDRTLLHVHDAPDASLTFARYLESSPGSYPVGLGIHQLLRIMALDVMAVKAAGQDAPYLSLSTWYSNQFQHSPAVDPYHLLLNSDTRNDVTAAALCRFLDVEYPADFDNDPLGQAKAAQSLLTLAGF